MSGSLGEVLVIVLSIYDVIYIVEGLIDEDILREPLRFKDKR